MVPKLNKRGDITELFIMLAVMSILCSIALIVILLFNELASNRATLEMQEERAKLGEKTFLINLLKSESTKEQIISLHFNPYDENTRGLLAQNINSALTRAFGEKVCWRIYIDDLEVSETNECKWISAIYYDELKAKVYLPYYGDEAGVLAISFGERL